MKATRFDLLFKMERVAELRFESLDQPWVAGRLVRLLADADIRRQMRLMVAEPPVELETAGFANDFLDEGNWHLRTSSGEVLEISVPAVHEHSGEVFWRWRPAQPGEKEPFFERLAYLNEEARN
jgi:hypothetical protein